jgi:hypothetical protein
LTALIYYWENETLRADYFFAVVMIAQKRGYLFDYRSLSRNVLVSQATSHFFFMEIIQWSMGNHDTKETN